MDAVLGLSMTPTTVGLVLVEGQDADGATMDHDAFAVRPNGRSGVAEACEQAAAAVLRSEAMAATRGHRLHSIGVTWSEDADAEASMLLRSLSESGFDNVVAVRLPEATEALARGIADAIGYDTTAVCVIEPDTVVALIVHLHDGDVQTTVAHGIDDEEALTRWLSTVFARASWEPAALVVVGSVDGLDEVMPSLEDALGVPVFAPAEADVALARGAALASTHLDDHDYQGDFPVTDTAEEEPRRKSASLVGPMAMLVGGTLTFVVSVSLAIGLHLVADGDTAQREQVQTADTAETPAAVQQQAPAFPPPVAIPTPLPIDPPPPAELAPDEPVAAEAPIDVPAPESAPTGDVPPGDAAPAPDGVLPPPAPVPADQAVPPKKPGLLSRIRDRIGPDDDVQAPVEMPPPPPVPYTPDAPPPPS